MQTESIFGGFPPKTARSAKICCGSNMGKCRQGRQRARLACCPDRGKTFRKESFKVFCPTFCTLQKVGKSGEAAKGFNFVCAKPPLRCADSRFAKPRCSLRGRTGCHFLRCAKSNQKAHGAKPCDPRFKALPKVSLQKLPAAPVEIGFACKPPA